MKIIFIHTHPIQYFAPLYAYLHRQQMDMEVWYCDKGNGPDHEFTHRHAWDIQLLEGYPSRFFTNQGDGSRSQTRGMGAYNNPDMLKALQHHPPAVVVVHGWSYGTYIKVLNKAKKWGHRLWFRGEANLPMELARPAWQQTVRKIMLRYLLRHTEKLFAIGTHSHHCYRWMGFPERKISLAPYAVDNERFQQVAGSVSPSEARGELQWPEGSFIFLFTGKFIEKKRPLDILRAFALLNHSNACLVMVGDGPLRPAIETFIATHRLQDTVLLAGFINQQQMPLAYRAADALIMASDYGETWGLSVNEGMNARLPLILSDRVGCFPDLLQPQKNGLGFGCRHVQGLAKAMQTMLEKSPEALREMGEKSLALVNQFSYEAIEKAFKQQLSEK